MKKAIIIIIIIINIINIKIARARLIYRSPEIKGQIVDATTGEPIEKAIINALWWGYAGTQLGGGASPFKIVTVITGKDGKYTIPEYTKIYIRGIGSILNTFSHQSIEIYHPLYENTRLGYVWRKDDETGEEKFKGTKLPDGTIRYDIKLLGIEEAIRRGAEEYARTKDWHKLFSFTSYIGTYSGSFFKDHWDKKFVEDILEKWKEIAIKGEIYNGSTKRELDRLEKEIEEAYKGKSK